MLAVLSHSTFTSAVHSQLIQHVWELTDDGTGTNIFKGNDTFRAIHHKYLTIYKHIIYNIYLHELEIKLK